MPKKPVLTPVASLILARATDTLALNGFDLHEALDYIVD